MVKGGLGHAELATWCRCEPTYLLQEHWFAYQSFVGSEFDGLAGLPASVGDVWPFLVTGIDVVPAGLRLRTLRRVRLGRA